ncbi:hypothetical protein ACWEPC_55720 [Nonomuraea sp. NPDC004297]
MRLPGINAIFHDPTAAALTADGSVVPGPGGAAAGVRGPGGDDSDDGKPAAQRPLPDIAEFMGQWVVVGGAADKGAYVVVPPETSAPTRTWSADGHRQSVRAPAEGGHQVAMTGTEHDLTAHVTGDVTVGLSGVTTGVTQGETTSVATGVATGMTTGATTSADPATVIEPTPRPSDRARSCRPAPAPHIWQRPPAHGSRTGPPSHGSAAAPGRPCPSRNSK